MSANADLDADVRLDEPRDLPQAPAELAEILRAVGRRVRLLADRFDHPAPRRRCPCPAPSAARRSTSAYRLSRIAAASWLRTWNCGRSSTAIAPRLPRSVRGSCAPDRDGAHRRGVAAASGSARFNQPSSILHARRARLHVVLSVEVRAVVGRAGGMDDGELAAVPQRLQRLQRWMQRKAAVQIDARRSALARSAAPRSSAAARSSASRRTGRRCSGRQPRRAERSRSGSCACPALRRSAEQPRRAPRPGRRWSIADARMN